MLITLKYSDLVKMLCTLDTKAALLGINLRLTLLEKSQHHWLTVYNAVKRLELKM